MSDLFIFCLHACKVTHFLAEIIFFLRIFLHNSKVSRNFALAYKMIVPSIRSEQP